MNRPDTFFTVLKTEDEYNLSSRLVVEALAKRGLNAFPIPSLDSGLIDTLSWRHEAKAVSLFDSERTVFYLNPRENQESDVPRWTLIAEYQVGVGRHISTEELADQFVARELSEIFNLSRQQS